MAATGVEPLDKPRNKLFLTGASGLLGRAAMKYFISSGWEVYGTARSRALPPLKYLDLTRLNDVKEALDAFQPSFVLHCAAERHPDKVDDDLQSAKLLNHVATLSLAKQCYEMRVPMICISTDYVFDGKSAPYSVGDPTSPVNLYGDTKVMGEKATLRFPGHIVLRVSVLYGRVEHLWESAVTCLLDMLMNKSKEHVVSNYERRRPVHVDDVAKICHLLIEERLKNPKVCGIFHWCGPEEMTKYVMVQKMAKVFNLNADHIFPSTGIPDPGASPIRPYNTTLDISRIQSMFPDHTSLPFETDIYNSLLSWVEEYHNKSINQ